MNAGPPDAPYGAGGEPFSLTPEQHQIAALLERLLGRAVANRYIDFTRLASASTGLRASIPMAAHALRELDGIVRDALRVPMEAELAESDHDVARLKRALKLLKNSGYGAAALQRARKALTPRHNHATEIKLIAARLGFSADSDIVRAWISLTGAAGEAHKRHFHQSMNVDDSFRNNFQRPLDLVLGGILVALQKHYAAFLKRVETIAAMLDKVKAVSLFAAEIPSSMPLQWHFYQTIQSPDWLPLLLDRQLVREPLVDEESEVTDYGPWPIGHYLLSVAKAGDAKGIPHLAKALRTIQGSSHPAVKRSGLEVIAALPAEDANDLVDIVTRWLRQDTPNFYYTAADVILKRLADNGYTESALKVAASLFRVFEHGGEVASIHPIHMYEHLLPGAVKTLASRDALATVHLLSELVLDAARISNKVPDDDYSYHTPHPLADSQMAQYGIWEALIIALRDASICACQTEPAQTEAVVRFLIDRGLLIFKRIAIHVLSKNAAAAPGLAVNFLTDSNLIDQNWCEDEYAELALAYFPQLLPEQQQSILSFIDELPDRFRESWRKRFAANRNAAPTAEDERLYEIAVIREALWKWRSVLPSKRQQLLEASVATLGDPENLHDRLFPPEVSALSSADFVARSMHDILTLLRSFVPSEEPVRHTINALGQQLRAAVEQEPTRLADVASAFADLRPIYIRRLLEGFEPSATNGKALAWGSILDLISTLAERLKCPTNAFPRADGDDDDWHWCCSTAARLLKSGLGHLRAGITLDEAPQIEGIITTFFEAAPHQPSSRDFEKEFSKHPAFTAGQPLWGSATELCLNYIWWHSRQPASPVAKEPRSALDLLPQIASLLERGLEDQSLWGRIPRAVLGGRLTWLAHYGDAWLNQRLPLLFPEDEALCRAGFLAHLSSDTGPVQSRMVTQFLMPRYEDEINRLDDDLDDDSAFHRAKRLGDYLLVLWIADFMPDAIMNRFSGRAPAQIRRHTIGYLGRTLQLPEAKLPAISRARARHFWEMRLAAASAASDKETYREELSAIGQWFIHDAENIDADWLFKQLLALFKAGFAPNNGYSLIEWLGHIAPSHPAQAVAVFAEMLGSQHLHLGAYSTHTGPIRTVLQQGLMADSVSAQRARDVINMLATMAKPDYLDLLGPQH